MPRCHGEASSERPKVPSVSQLLQSSAFPFGAADTQGPKPWASAGPFASFALAVIPVG